MATRKVNALEEEKMTPANLQRVINLLEPEEGTPITKKLACELLGMAYNTTRLGNILQQFKDKKERDRKHRAAKRGTAATKDEILYIIPEYLQGATLDNIANSIYRSSAFVKNVLETYSVPIRASSHDYFKPELIPEAAVRERFKVDEVVYSARYDSIARIDAEREFSEKHGWVYRLWLLSEKWKQSCYQPASELASLQHLKELGIKI